MAMLLDEHKGIRQCLDGDGNWWTPGEPIRLKERRIALKEYWICCSSSEQMDSTDFLSEMLIKNHQQWCRNYKPLTNRNDMNSGVVWG